MRTCQLFPDTVEQARALGRERDAEGFEYYRTDRARHPRSTEHLPWRASTASRPSTPSGSPTRPLLMVVGRRAVTSWMAVAAFQQARGPKEPHWIEGASHVDRYDREPHVSAAVEKLTAFYRTHLA